MVRNECFRVALDYLYKNGLIADQRELSEKIGVSETSISQIVNNRVRKPSETTIRKLNEAFGNIFNPKYFRGQSVHLLIKDAAQEEGASTSEQKQQEQQNVPKWLDALLYRQTEQQKEIEELRRLFKATLEKVDAMTDKLEKLLQKQTREGYILHAPTYLAAAEPK